MENKAKINPKRLGVLEAYQEGQSVSVINKNFPDISQTTIYNWIKEYKEGKITRKPREITAKKKAFYEKVLALHKLGLSYRAIQREIKLVDITTIRRWIMSSVKTNSPHVTEKTENTVSKKNSIEKAALYDGMTPEELLIRYRQLLDQNKRQRIQISLAEKMIDVAEEEFGIAIRKKSGAK